MSSARREETSKQLADAIRTYHVAFEAVDDAACEYMGINRTDLRCLDILGRAGPMSAGQLAEESKLTNAAITVVLDRMERAGYMRRVRDTVDRRRVMVDATPKAHTRAWALYGKIAEKLYDQLERYSDEELELLRDFLRARTEIDLEVAAEFRQRRPLSTRARRARAGSA
ncbi:MAG: MarR family winged helix-turn-helix transcriptional regulator [Gaiellaceae bacterium]